MTGEDWVAVADDRAGEAVQTHDPVEEGTRNRGGRVRVTEGDEVSIFGEAIHHRQDHRLAVDFRQALNEIHGDVSRHLGRHIQGLQEACRLRGRRLIPLTGVAGADEVMNQVSIARYVEVSSEAHKGFLDPLVPR